MPLVSWRIHIAAPHVMHITMDVMVKSVAMCTGGAIKYPLINCALMDPNRPMAVSNPIAVVRILVGYDSAESTSS